jgi:hypothetical protein
MAKEVCRNVKHIENSPRPSTEDQEGNLKEGQKEAEGIERMGIEVQPQHQYQNRTQNMK